MPSKKRMLDLATGNNDGINGDDQHLLELEMTVIKIIKKS